MKYQVCSRCVMDTSDSLITFDEKGECSHCKKFDEEILPYWKTFSKDWLDRKISAIKEECKNNPYDVIIGLSGGLDSSYLLHYMKTHYDLRILAVHTDAGWNTEIAKANIQKLVKKLGIKLHTIVIDWEEMRDLQVAILKSGVANCDLPQEMAYFAALYKYATENQVKYVMTGSNFATESIQPPLSWEHNRMDSQQLRDIHAKFGKIPLVKFPIMSFFDYYILYQHILKMKVLSPLNNIPYSKEIAIKALCEEYNWEPYEDKHCESIWAKFVQEYFLPTKFGYDKRRPHYSSLILSGEMTRELALEKLAMPPYNQELLKKDLEYILSKLNLTQSDWEEIMKIPNKSYKEYKNNEQLYLLKKQYLDLLFV